MRTAALILPLLTSRVLLAAASSADTADTSLCLLLRDPQKYAGREATMTVGYRAGFEWQELVCAACGMTEKVWAEFDADVKGARKLGKFTGRFDSLYRVRVRGVLSERGHYGHSNGYDYQFRVNEVLAAKRLWQMSPHQPKVPENILRDACAPQTSARQKDVPATGRQPIPVEFWHVGDDGLSQKLIVAVETAFRQSSDFRLVPIGAGRRLVVTIMRNVQWEPVGEKIKATYTVRFSSLDGNASANPDLQERSALAKEIRTRKGSCWDSDLPKCAAQIVDEARIATRDLPD